jgi:hypothetical protein
MLTHKYVATGASLDFEPPERPTGPNPWQVISAVVSAAVATASFLTQWKGNNRPLAFLLGAIALVVIVSAFYRALASAIRKAIRNWRRNRLARKSWDEFLRMEKRFGAFLNKDGPNLRKIISDICNRNEDEISKFYGRDYLTDYYGLIYMRHLKNRAKKHYAFHLALTELHQMVCSYNQDYALDLFKKLNGSVPLAQAQPHAREHYQEGMKQFREQWVTFLNDFIEFLDKTNHDMRYDDYREKIGMHFEYPKTL